MCKYDSIFHYIQKSALLNETFEIHLAEKSYN